MFPQRRLTDSLISLSEKRSQNNNLPSRVLKCYIDGEIVSKDWVGEIRTGDGPVVIGTWGANFFAGALDEAVIYNVALTEEQLRSDYENGFTAVSPAGRLSTTWAEIKAE